MMLNQFRTWEGVVPLRRSATSTDLVGNDDINEIRGGHQLLLPPAHAEVPDRLRPDRDRAGRDGRQHAEGLRAPHAGAVHLLDGSDAMQHGGSDTMKRALVTAVVVVAARLATTLGVSAPSGRRKSIPAIPALSEDQRRLGQSQQHRVGLDEQPDDALGRDVPQVLSERQGAGGRQGLVDGAAGADRRHGAVRPDVAADAVDRDRSVPAELRLQADRDPDQLRRAVGVRPPRQPDQAAVAGAGRGDLRQEPPPRLQAERHHLGPARV